MELTLTRWVKQLAGYSERKPGSFCPAPVAPESQAATATAFACPVGSVSLSLGPRIPLVPYRPPWQRQVRLRFRHPDSREPASKPLPLTAGLLSCCHKRLVAERHSPAR